MSCFTKSVLPLTLIASKIFSTAINRLEASARHLPTEYRIKWLFLKNRRLGIDEKVVNSEIKLEINNPPVLSPLKSGEIREVW